MPNQVESYQDVIDVVGDINFDYDARAILLQIAKTHPQVVVDAASYLKRGPVKLYGVSQSVMNSLLAGRKIEAIKQQRLDTGMGLKEAKDAVEDVIVKDRTIGEIFRRE